MSIYFPPVQIDQSGNFGDQSLNIEAGTSTFQGPWLVNGALFLCLIPTGDSHGVPAGYPGYVGSANIWTSTDNGQTWTEVDAANAPACCQGQSCFDGDHTITVVFTPSPSAGPGSTVTMSIAQFDCLTGSWGAASGPSGFSHVEAATGPYAILPRPDGSFIIIFPFFISIGFFGLSAASWKAGTWSSDFRIDTNALAAMTGYEGAYFGALATVDAGGTTHVFFGDVDGSFNENMFYQAITAGNALGSFFQFPDVMTAVNGNFGIPCINGAQLVLPVFGIVGGVNVPSLYVGTPLNAPVWTLFQNIDPAMLTAQPAGIGGIYSNAAAIIDGQVQLAVLWPTADVAYENGVIRICTTSDFVNWVFTCSTAYDVEADGPVAFQVGGAQIIQNPMLTPQGLGVRALDPTDTEFVKFWFTPSASPIVITGNPVDGQVGTPYTFSFTVTGGTLPYTYSISGGSLPPGLHLAGDGKIVGTPSQVGTFDFVFSVNGTGLSSSITILSSSTNPISGGGPPSALCDRRINLYDLCAEDEVRRMKRIQFPPMCNIPPCLLPWEEDYTPVPAGAVPFHITGTITTPTTADGDVLVCQGMVPLGYDGLITEIFQNYQGSGFQQGSGDIVWRIKRNQQWLKELGNNPFALGRPTKPVQLTQGQIVFSGTLFQFYVNVPNLSGMIQIGASSITCGLNGFYWPRG